MTGNHLDAKFLEAEFFAKLYCREIGVVPDEGSCHAEYFDFGNNGSYMRITYKTKDKYFDEIIQPIDLFNLISKHILKGAK